MSKLRHYMVNRLRFNTMEGISVGLTTEAMSRPPTGVRWKMVYLRDGRRATEIYVGYKDDRMGRKYRIYTHGDDTLGIAVFTLLYFGNTGKIPRIVEHGTYEELVA